MIVTREAIIAEGHRWIGTPHHRQASVRGVGCDCKGLIAGIARELGLPEGRSLAALAADYGPVVDEARLRAGLEETLPRVDSPAPADVLLIIMNGKAQHLGLFIGGARMIHCWDRGRYCVISGPLPPARKIDSFWTWPSLDGY